MYKPTKEWGGLSDVENKPKRPILFTLWRLKLLIVSVVSFFAGMVVATVLTKAIKWVLVLGVITVVGVVAYYWITKWIRQRQTKKVLEKW